MSGQSGVAIDIRNVAKTFPDGTRALKPVSLGIGAGEVIVLLGPSGCGKTTLLRIIAGLERADAGGKVLFDGQDVSAVEIEKRNVGMVFQSYALFPNMSVAENIGYGLRLRKMPPAQRDARIREMLALTGIEALADRRIDQLSGGQKQRVALARAVAIRPRVLLLDEPLTALDAALRERLRTELDSLLRMLAITAIYVTHDQAEAMALGDRIVVMRQGDIIEQGSPRDIYLRPKTKFVAGFVGAANVLSGRVGDGQLHLAGGSLALGAGSAGDAFMIRPETIMLAAPDDATWRGRIASIAFLGDRQRLVITGAAEIPVTVETDNRRTFTVGEAVGLVVSSESIIPVAD